MSADPIPQNVARSAESDAQTAAPVTMTGTIEPNVPPEAPEPQPVPLMRALMPVVMIVAVGGMVAMMFISGMARNPMSFMFPMMMIVSMLGMVVGGGGTKSADIGPARRDYQRHLSSIRRAVVKASQQQRAKAVHMHPDPQDLWCAVAAGRAFERDKASPNFMAVRVGIGPQLPATPVVPPAVPTPEKLDPVSAVALRNVVQRARVVPNLPVAIDIKAFPIIAIDGEQSIELARAMIAQSACFHHPTDLGIAYIGQGTQWNWLKWLPHQWNREQHDASGPKRLRFTRITEAVEAIASLQNPPKTLLLLINSELDLVDNEIRALVALVDAPSHKSRSSGEVGLSHVTVIAPGAQTDSLLWHAAVETGLALRTSAGTLSAETAAGEEEIAVPDCFGAAGAEMLARSLTWRVDPCLSTGEAVDDRDPVLSELGVDVAVEKRTFSLRRGKTRLRIPIGKQEDEKPFYLDIKESSEGGVGPHGLCVGATGSGKSEFLRSVVAGLAATHSPDQLNFVLVDFKGGATFLGLEDLPHVSAVITNLADELILVDRMYDAIKGELNRRQELLRVAGNFANVGEYERSRESGNTKLSPLPALVIVVDEFSELLSARPEFAELFVAVGRLGRSLHVHLLLASQRLEEGRLRGLESHLSYRIGLKTFSAAESRSVLGVPDAYQLPSLPGVGYIKTGSGDPVRFRSAFVSGPLPEHETPKRSASDNPYAPAVVPFTADNTECVADNSVFKSTQPNGRLTVLADQKSGEKPPSKLLSDSSGTDATKTVLSCLVDSLAYLPKSAHQVWLPPLPDRIELSELAEKANETGIEPAALRAVIGIMDRPFEQRQDVFNIDISSTGGHIAVVGAPRSGKTTALRTILLGLANYASAEQLHFYVIDYGAGGLSDLKELPHVSMVAHRGDTESIRRVVGFLKAEVQRRDELFRENSWHGIEDARAGGVPDLVLTIDGWPGFKNEQIKLSDVIQEITSDGLSVGIHVMLSAHRWTEFRPSMRDLLGTRVELRQAEAIDSVIDRKLAAQVPQAAGRGLSASGHALLVADSTPTDTARAALAFRRQFPHSVGAPKLKLLPKFISNPALLALVGKEKSSSVVLPAKSHMDRTNSSAIEKLDLGALIPIGVEESKLSLVYFDLDRERNLLILGSAGSGRTSVIRTLLTNLSSNALAKSFVAEAQHPSPAPNRKFVVIDYRRGLIDALDSTVLAGYAGSSAVAEPMIAELANTLSKRLPPMNITPDQLRSRSWWDGPEITLVVDDYELVAGGKRNPLLPLAELIPHAADIGLSIVLARRISGCHRALHDQVMGALKDQGATALLLDGTKEDGPLFGCAVTSQPPGRGNWISHGCTPQIVQCASVESPIAEEPGDD